MKVEQIMKGFIYSISEGRFKQAERLIRKNSRNKGNELSKELLPLGFFYGIVENYDSAIFCLELAPGITKDTRIRSEAKKYLAVAHNILGIRLTRMGLLDQAEAHYKEELVKKNIQEEIDGIEDREKKERIETSWDQCKRTASATANLLGFVASVIQIYLFLNDGKMDIALDQMKSLLTNFLGRIY